ncbi:MAG: DUF4347 domain-containing protein, partial [Sulfuritalea sp.]|nr:DUF4347 domain-containing protein [Sulfuritalea sp.]
MIENHLIQNRANVAQRLRAFLKVPASRRRVTPTRPRMLHVEAMEPRFLLSGEGLILPPPPPPQEAPLAAPIQIPAAQLASQVLPVQNLGATGAQTPATNANEVIFVDPQVKDYSALVAAALQARPGQAAPARVEVVVLDANQDGVDQITAWLKGHQDLQAVHVLSHGDEAALRLGVTSLSQANLDDYRQQFAAWGAALAPGADLLLYGCDVAAGEDGVAFVDRLAQLTGADVAASTGATGASALGGNWILEKTTGALETASLFAVTPDYNHLLAAVTPNKSGDMGSTISANNAFNAAVNLGAQLDANAEFAYSMPMVDLTFTGLTRTNDGRTLGDLIGFKTLSGTTVLDDYLAAGGTTMGGLMDRMGDYLNGIGAYSNLESVVDHSGSAISFSATGQVLTATLTLSREFIQRFGFGEQLKALGLDFQGGQGIPLLADVHYTGIYDLTYGTIGVTALDARVQVKNSAFSAGMALGVVDATASGTLNFDTGKVEFNAIGASIAGLFLGYTGRLAGEVKLPMVAGYTDADNLFTVKSASAHAVKTNASFDVTGSIGSTTLATIAGGTPHINVAFGGLSLTSLETNAAQPTITGTASLLSGQTLKVTVAGATYTVTPAGDATWSLNLGTATPASGTLALGSGVTTDVTAKVVKTTGGATVSTVTGTIKVNPTVDAVTAHTLTPTLSGVARLSAAQTLSVVVGGATYSVTPAANGAWTLNLGTATPTSGALVLATGNNYTITATVSGGVPAVTGQLAVNTALASTTTTPPSTSSTPGVTTTGSVAWNSLQPAPLTLTSTNFSNLQALSSLTSTQVVKMLQDLGTYLTLLRDSGNFDALLPFTDLKLGEALDFSATMNDIIDNQLATTIRSGMTASKAISPVLGSDVVFDLQVQRPGDERVTTLAIAVAWTETSAFTHINQLAGLIGQKISAAVNGWLARSGSATVEITESLKGGITVSGGNNTSEEQTLAVHASSGTYQLRVGAGGTVTGDISVLATPIEVQNALEAVVGVGNVLVTGRPKHYLVNFIGTQAETDIAALQVASSALTTGSLIDVTAGEFSRYADGKTWGKLSLLQANPGDFSVLRVAPSSGLSVQVIAAGADDVEAVQRLFVIHGGNGSFILKGAGGAFTTDPISLDGLDATAAQNAILNALMAKLTTVTGMSVAEVSGDYAADNGTRVFEIGFGKIPVTPATDPATTKYSNYGAMTADLTTASVTIDQTAAGDQSTNAVQKLTIEKNRAGFFVLKGTNSSGAAFVTSPLAYGASAADIQTALRSAVGLATLTVAISGVTGDVITMALGQKYIFNVTFEQKNYAKMTASNVWTSKVLAQAVVSTRQLATAAVGATPATNEIQRMTIANASGGSFVLGITLDALLFQTGDIAYNASAADVKAALVGMLQKWNSAVVSGDVDVSTSGNFYDIEFKGRWAAKDVPQLRINSQKLTSPASSSYTALDNLGFLAAGQDSQINNVTTFVTLDQMMERFQHAVNLNLNGGAAFSVNPRFDATTKSFLFDVRLTPGHKQAVALNVSSNVGDLSRLSTDTSLDLTTETNFEATIGFDFANLNTFALRASGAYTGTITASAGGANLSVSSWNNAGGFFGDAPFRISFNGEAYDLKLLLSDVSGNTTRDNLVVDLQAVFAAQSVTPGGVLARRGFANLGQAVTVGKKTDGQLTLTISVPVGQVQLTVLPPSNSVLNAMDYVLGFKTMPAYPAPKAVVLPATGVLTADAHFSLKVDQSVAIAVTITSASTSTNMTTADLISDINTALNGLSISSHAYLGTGAGGKGFSNLGQVIQASLRNGQIELVTQSAKIASLQMDISGSDTATRELGFTPGQFSTTTGAYVFLQDVTLGGNYSAVIHGQVGATAATLATPGQATLGMLDLTFDELAADYQGSLSFDLRNGLAGAAHDRISLNDLFDSASAQDGLLGLGGALSTSDTVSSPNAPYQSNGRLLRDVGLSVTVGSAVLDVVVTKSATAGNTSVADLASDVNAAIHTALVAKFTTDPYVTHTFVTADSTSVAGKTVLKFTAPTTTLTLASTPTQIYNASSGVLLLDLPLTVTLGGTGATVDVLVRASNTAANTTLAELVTDVDNTIKLALASAKNNTADASVKTAIDTLLAATDLVGQSGGALTLKAGTVAAKTITLKNLSVSDRLLKDDFSTALVFLNQAGTASTVPTAALTFSSIGITTPAGISATGLNPATTITVDVTNAADALAGTAVQAIASVVPPDGLGSLTPFKDIAWTDLRSDIGQLGSLLGDLGGVGAFGELGRALPVLGSSVSELFDFSTRFAAIDSALSTQSGIGLVGLKTALATAFGIDASAVTLSYSSGNQALNIDVPYRVVLDQTAQIELILNDTGLLALLSDADKATLSTLLGSMTRLKDADSSALLNLHADMTFHLAMGVDLSSGANQGKLFLYDHVLGGAAGFAGDTGTYATLDALTASASGMAFSAVQGIYSLGVTGGTASLSVAGTSGLMLHSDDKDGAADGRLYLRPYSALSSANATALKQSNFEVVFDGSASVVLPMTLSVSDDLGQLAMAQIDGFINPLPMGKMEVNFVNLGDSFAKMGGKTGFTLQSTAEGTNSNTIISGQVRQSALPERPATGNGSAATTPEGAPIDSADESGLANVNPNPYFSSAEGAGASTAPSSLTVDITKLFAAGPTSNAPATGFDVSLIIPDFAYWQTQLTQVLSAAVGSSDDPDKIINGPLIFLLRDPTIIVDTVDKVLGGLQQGLDAFSSVLNVPIIGDQLKEATQFVADLRSNVVGAIKRALDEAIDVYGGLDNALRMFLFDMLTTDTNGDYIVQASEINNNVFLNFLRDYNGDSLITPDDIVVEYLAGTGQPEIDDRLAEYLGVAQTSGPLPSVLPGQRTAWVTSGLNEVKKDTLGNTLYHDDGTARYTGKAGYVVLDSSLQKIVDDVAGAIDSVASTALDAVANITHNYGSGFTESATAFAEFVIDKVVVEGYDYGSLLKDVFGAGVIAASLADVFDSFAPSDASLAADAAVVKYNYDNRDVPGFVNKIPKAILGEFKKAVQAQAEEIAAELALGSSTAIQFRMNLGQTYTPSLDLSFDIGVPGLNLTMDGGIGLNLDWDLFLGFGIDINDGFYLVTNMPGTAGIGETTTYSSAPGKAGVATGTAVNSDDAHIDNLWLVGKPTFTPAVTELQAQIDVYLTPGSGNQPASLNAQLLYLNGRLTDNWDGWIKDNDTGIWGSGTDSMGRLTGTQNANYGRTVGMFDGDTGADGSRTRLQLNFGVNLKDVGLFGISALSDFTNGRLTFADLRNAELADLYEVEWDAKAQINLHMSLGVSLSALGVEEGYLPKVIGDFHLTWQDSNENEYVKQINQYFTSGYDKLFHAGEPNIWMSDIYIDVGSFFTKFLNPIVSVIQDVTDPIMPVIDALTTPIPGLSDLMGREYSVVDLASDMSALFGGVSKLDFIIAMVNLLDVIDNLPTNTAGMLLPVKEALIISGTKDRKLNLAALPSVIPDVDISLPYLQMADVNVSQDGFEFGLNMGVGWKDDPLTSGTNEGETTLLQVFQGQTPDLRFDFDLTADARIPAPYVDATPFDFTIAGIYERGSTTVLATFKLNIKAGWPDLRLSDILSGNMAPRFDVTLQLPDIDFTPNLLPLLKLKLPRMVATANSVTHVLLEGGEIDLAWPDLVSSFVNSGSTKILDLSGPSFDVNLGNLPDFLLPLPYVDLTPIDISADCGFASGSVLLNLQAGWKNVWLSDLLGGDIAPTIHATFDIAAGININTQVLPVLQVKLPAMKWTMGAKEWTWLSGGTTTLDWPSALSGFVNTGNIKTIDLSASAQINLGTIDGFLPTITVEWPDVHWIGLGKEFSWTQTDSTDLGWSSIISDAGILSALIDPSSQITIKMPDVWLPAVNLLDLLPDIDWSFSLPGLPSLPSIDIGLPDIDVPGQQTVSPQQAFSDFQDKLKKPGSALKFPIIDDPVGSVIGLLMGEPVDLMTFTPQNLEVSVGFRVSFPIYPPLYVGIGGDISIEAALTLGFDTYGVTKFFNSHNLVDIFDGFYVSDNIENGVDLPEVTLEAKLYAYAELNAFIVRGGVEGGIKLVGTLDIYDEDKDNKYRASELIAAVSEDPLDVVEMHLRGSAYISAYVDIFAIFDWVRVWEWTFMDVTLFEWEHDPASKKPVLGSMDGNTLTLHMGSTIGSIDGQDSITKGAADRLRRSTDDGNESYTLTGSAGTVNISAILTNGSTYTKTFASVNKVKAFAGAGNDTIDASALDRSVLFIAGGGTDVLKGGSAADVLIGSDSGTATLEGNGGDDLLIARGGTTHMKGGADTDSYRFLSGWGLADIIDSSGSNVLDFRVQTSVVTFDDSVGEAFQGSNRVTWTNGSDKIDLVKGGSGSDIIDFSGDAANLLISVTATDAGWVNGSGAGMTQTSFAGTTASAMTTAGDNAGFGFKFEGFENAIGGQGSDVFRMSNGASLTGSLQGDTAAGLHHDVSGNEIANARNILDFSEYTTGVVVNEESTSAFGTASASNIIVRGFHDIFGGSGGDRLSGDGRNNMLVGNDGTDVLEGKAAHDLLVADTFQTYKNLTGVETAPTSLTNVTDYLSLQVVGAGEFGAASRNWIWKGQTILNKALTTAGSQTLKGGGGNDIIMGSKGGDIINIGGSGEGNDTIISDLGKVEVDFNYRSALSATSITTQGGGNDTIYLGAGNNLVIAGNGKDTIIGADVAGSFNIILSDNGTVKFKTAEVSTASGTKLTFATVSGLTHLIDTIDAPVSENGGVGNADVVSLSSGSAIVLGGLGADVISFNAATSTGANVRFVAGDHASIQTDARGGITEFYTLDTASNTGGDDVIVIGSAADLATRHLGTNFVLGGMGADTIIVSGAIDSLGTITRGLARSEDAILGDNGKITRTDSIAASSTRNLMLKVESTQTANATGGADKIIVANGGKLIVGGVGDDTITARDGDHLVIGDNGQIDFDAANTGILRRMQATAIDQGGNDTITLENGFKLVIGGFGSDIVDIIANNLGEAIGPITVTGIAAVTGSVDQKRGRSGRTVAGDNAQIDFDATGAMTDLVTLDTQAATGGGDLIQIAAALTSGQIGVNLVVGGMGGDTVLVGGASYDSVLKKLTAGAVFSEDILIGDNGEIHRTTAISSTDYSNLMLQAKTKLGDQGGNDIIGSGSGGKIMLGGFGSDLIAARDGDHIVAGDNAEANYDVNAKNGILRELKAAELTLGGSDTITLNEGYKVVMGGIGGDASSFDTIDIIATGIGHAVGSSISGQVRGLTGIDTVTAATEAETKGRTGRFVVGDNATISFDGKGGLTDMVTSDAIAATGGRDAITLGAQSIAAGTDLGYQVVIGGMAADTINIRSTSRSEDYILGDNGEFHRTASGYGVTAITSTAAGQGGADSITSGRGVKLVIGGDGADAINLATTFESGKTDRALVVGDSGDIRFDAAGGELLESVTSYLGSPGGMDSLIVGDGGVIFVGGQAADTMTVNSTLSYFRAGVGDNAVLQFATADTWESSGRPLADLIYLQTTDTSAPTGGDDSFQVGYAGDSAHSMGEALLVGGVGGDSLVVAGSDATTILVGDNAEIRRSPGVDAKPLAVTSLSLDQGGGDTLETVAGWHLLVGGMAGDTIRSGKGEGVVLGDSGTVLYSIAGSGLSSGMLTAVTSTGLSQGGADIISLGAGSAAMDGNQVVIGGFGADTIGMVALAGHERMISGDAADIRFDTQGRMVSFATSDATASTGGNDQITVGVGGTVWPAAGVDVNVVAGGIGDDHIALNAGGFTTDVVSGDNLDYRRGLDGSGNYQHRFADVLSPLLGGNDDVLVGGGDKLVFGGAGNDTLETRTGTGAGERALIFGDAGTITFDTTLSGKLVRAFTTAEDAGGNDSLKVAGGSAYLFGGKGNDSFTSASYALERVAFGDNGQIDWSTSGANSGMMTRLQTTGSDLLDPALTVDSFILPLGLPTNAPAPDYAADTSRNFIFGGPGVDLLSGTPDHANNDDVLMPGTGAATNPGQGGQVVSVVMLGDYLEFGMVPADYSPARVNPDPNAPVIPGGGGSVTGSITGTGAVTEDTVTTANGQLAYPSINGGSASFTAQPATVGAYGNFVLDSGGNWSFSLDHAKADFLAAGQQVAETFVARTTEGSSTTVTITVTGINDTSVLGGVVTGTVAEDGTATASGALSISDVDTNDNPVSFADVASTAGSNGYGSFVLSSGTWTYSLDNAAVQFLDAGQSATDSITYTA